MSVHGERDGLGISEDTLVVDVDAVYFGVVFLVHYLLDLTFIDLAFCPIRKARLWVACPAVVAVDMITEVWDWRGISVELLLVKG